MRKASWSGGVLHVGDEVVEIERLAAKSRRIVAQSRGQGYIRRDHHHGQIRAARLFAHVQNELLSRHFRKVKARNDEIVFGREHLERMLRAMDDVHSMALLREVELKERGEGPFSFDDEDEQLSLLHDLGGTFGNSP